MRRVQLLHWNAAEAKVRAAKLRAAGYRVGVVSDARAVPAALLGLRENPPAAVVIDLGRLPSQGRDIALALRSYKATRHLPLVFLEGAPEKVARTRQLLPDASYGTWSRFRTVLKQAIAHPPKEPVVPRTRLDGYSGTPLPKKLGIKPGSVVALIGAPPDFKSTLGTLPQNVSLRAKARDRCDLIIWFTKSRRDLESRVERLGAQAGSGGLWIACPKKASGVATDLTQNDVRRAGLAAGLVDYKVCAIDATWTGLRFTRRKNQ